jgi:hypothetical protein
VFSAIGLSFYACAYIEDFNQGGFTPGPHGPFPPAVLTVAAAGGQFVVEDSPLATINMGKIHVIVDP